MKDAVLVEQVRRKFATLDAVIDERMRRQWAAAEARAAGWGGVTAVSLATGLSRNTVDAGIREVRARAKQRGRIVISPSPTARFAKGLRIRIVTPGLLQKQFDAGGRRWDANDSPEPGNF